MSSITCRYCPFYAPSLHTPVWGHCAGVFPPEKVGAITDNCPYHGDAEEIHKQELARGFSGHDLRRILYYGVSELGYRSRLYSSLADLLEFIEATGLEYMVYICYIDADNRTFSRAVIPADLRRLPS